MTNREIAEIAHIEESTVKTHVGNILDKLDPHRGRGLRLPNGSAHCSRGRLRTRFDPSVPYRRASRRLRGEAVAGASLVVSIVMPYCSER